MNTSSTPPVPPLTVRRAHRLWQLAVAAGLLETVLAVTQLTTGRGIGAGSLAAELGVRLTVFAVALALAGRMRRGSRVARWALTGLLGVLGLASLLVGPLGWLLAGHSPLDLRLDPLGWAFAGSRVVHVLAVVGAVVAMFTPSANRWFAAGPARIGASGRPRPTLVTEMGRRQER